MVNCICGGRPRYYISPRVTGVIKPDNFEYIECLNNNCKEHVRSYNNTVEQDWDILMIQKKTLKFLEEQKLEEQKLEERKLEEQENPYISGNI